MSKPKTKAQLDRATDQRLRKTYNISLLDYFYLLELGKGGCWICGRPEGERRLHVDHDHSWKKIKIETERFTNGCWGAKAFYNNELHIWIEEKKSLAVKGVKRLLLRASVRGLLCYQHNAGLQKFSDKKDWLWKAGDYISKFGDGSPLTGREIKNAS